MLNPSLTNFNIITKNYLIESKIDNKFIWENHCDLLCKLSKNEFESLLLTGIINKNNNFGIYCWKYFNFYRLNKITDDYIIIKFDLNDKNIYNIVEFTYQESIINFLYDLNILSNYINNFSRISFILETDKKLEYFENLIEKQY